jgi:hypothetical protein
MLFRKTLCKVEETEQCSDCCSDVDCDARKSRVETGTVAVEGEPLDHSRFVGQGPTDTNGACSGLVQGA